LALLAPCWSWGPTACCASIVNCRGIAPQIGLFGKPVAWDLDQVCYKELAVTGSNASVPPAWTRALKLFADGLVKTEPLVSGVFPLTEWWAAFDAFEKKSGLKSLLQPVH
jgi:L-iditol 2-dehydrogenase